VLVSTRRRKSTIPADMVFGMLAMLDQPKVNELALHISMPVEEVFVRFGKLYIRNEVRECLLNHTATLERLPGLPSWCPNFSSPRETLPIGTRWLGHWREKDDQETQMPCAGFQESGGKWAHPESKFQILKGLPNVLRGAEFDHHLYDTKNPRQIALLPGSDGILASGISLDTVVGIVDCNPAADLLDFLSQHSMHQTLIWDEECLKLAMENPPPGGFNHDVYARTITANRVTTEINIESEFLLDSKNKVDFEAGYLLFREHMEAKCAAEDDEDLNLLPSFPPSSKRFAECLGLMSRRRRFFCTKSGRIGLGPSDTRIGDNLVVIFYCPTPYLLRQSNPNWHFVGETYVHGLMYGEVLDIFDRGEVQETKWIID
jgi:hypothetical protein